MSIFFVGTGRCEDEPLFSDNIAFSFAPTSRYWPEDGQSYKAMYMTTGILGYNTDRDDYISAKEIKVTVSFSGTDNEAFSSDDALAMGIAAQGPQTEVGGVDWGYLLLLVMDGQHNYPYIQGMVWQVYEWGPNHNWPLEEPIAIDRSHWTWEYPSVLTVDSNVTLCMTWTGSTPGSCLEYNATVDGMEYHLYSYTPDEIVLPYFKLGLFDRFFPFTGTVKYLQFPGAWGLSDSEFPDSGWITHLSSPSLRMSGEQTWTNVNFSYSVDGFAPSGSGSWLDMTMCWGGWDFPDVSAHYFREPWSLPPSEPVNQVFFYPNETYTLPTDTLLWSVSPVNMTVENVIPILPNYDTVQVYHNGMRLNGEWLSMDYSVKVARTDLSDVTTVEVTAGIKRTNIQNASDYRVINTTTANMMAGQVQTFNLTWQETSTMKTGTWKISGFVDFVDNRVYWDTNTTDNEVANDTVEARELTGDFSGNGMVDIFDGIQLANAFNSHPGNKRWNPYCDLNTDSEIDIFDAILFAGNFGSSIGGGSGQGSQMGGKMMLDAGANIAVDPSQIAVFKDEVFSVDVKITNVMDLLGWEFKLYWNSTILNCTNALVQSPSEWQNNTQDYGPGLENSYNATHGRFFKAETAAYPEPSFNGSMTIATFAFKALQPGTTSLTLTETKLGNSTGDPIYHTESSGSVTVYHGRYMRSDTATVNGLNAYLLNATETTSYTYVQQVGQGAGAQFGIRAWVRASNGTEYEVTLDGQTGTPKATVTSTGWGTVNVTQKSMQMTFSLVIRVYVSIAGGAWTNKVTFTTEQLGKTSLLGNTWSVYYYVSVSYSVKLDRTTARFYWGDASHMSRIQNLQFT
jgi:hypothetical protein